MGHSGENRQIINIVLAIFSTPKPARFITKFLNWNMEKNKIDLPNLACPSVFNKILPALTSLRTSLIKVKLFFYSQSK